MDGFDRLEERVMLAGNVTATWSGWHLEIMGDDAANRIRVYSEMDHGGNTRIVVEGLDGTLVNAGSERAVFTDGVNTERITFDLGKGDDSIDVDGLSGLYPCDLHSEIRIVGGHGSDTVALADLDLPYWRIIATGISPVVENPNDPSTDDGNDVLSIGVRRTNVVVRSIEVEDVAGSNEVYITDAEILEASAIVLAGPDVTTARRSVVYLSGVTLGGELYVSTGDSADTVILSDVVQASGYDLSLETGGSDDRVAIYGSRLGYIYGDGGTGTDWFDVFDSTLENVELLNGSGGSAGNEERFGFYNTTVLASFAIETPDDNSGHDILATDRFWTGTGFTGMLVELGDGDDVIYQVGGGSRGALGFGVFFDLGGGNNSLGLNGVRYDNVPVFTNTGEGNDNISTGNGSRFLAIVAADSGGTNGFYFSDTTLRSLLSVGTCACTPSNNTVYLARTHIYGGSTGGLGIILGDFEDRVEILDGSVIRGDVVIDAGGGRDTVLVQDASVYGTNLAFALGDGDDTLTVERTAFQVAGTFAFDGGVGANTGSMRQSTRNKGIDILNFNSFPG